MLGSAGFSVKKGLTLGGAVFYPKAHMLRALGTLVTSSTAVFRFKTAPVQLK